MDKAFLPKKTTGWVALAGPLVILVLIFLPVRSTSGPAPKSLAKGIAARFAVTHVWPREGRDASTAPDGTPTRRYAYSLESADDGSAVYRIETGGRAERWRVSRIEPPRRLD